MSVVRRSRVRQNNAMPTLLPLAAMGTVIVFVLAGCAHGPSPDPFDGPGSATETPPAAFAVVGSHVMDVPIPVWLTTYAVLDNVENVERVDGDEELADRAADLMNQGSRAARAHPLAGEGEGGWPPHDATLSLELSARDVQAIQSALRDSLATVRSLLEDYPLTDAQREEQLLSEQLVREAVAFWG